MRISTVTLHQVSVNSITQNQSDLYKYENQVATGKRINSAADDPVGAARAAQLTSALSINTQYASNLTTAQNTLTQTESTVGDIGDSVASMQELLIEAGNGSLSASDKQTLAESLTNTMNQLLSLANTRDSATGKYLFSGFADSTAPFSLTTTGATYNGDSGLKQLAVSANVNATLNVTGSSLLMSARSGNGVIETTATSSNTGTGLVDGGQILNATAYDGSAFQLSFADGTSGLEYSVVNTTTGETVLSNQTYTDGTAIQIPLTASGSAVVSMTVTGTPAAGDSFTLDPSTTTDPFSTVMEAISALQGNAAGTVTNSQLTDVLRRTGTNLSQVYDKVLSVRGGLGSAMSEMETQTAINERQDTSLQSAKSDVTDVETAEAASNLARAQLAYDSSLSAYASVSKKSLFDYI
jgi:flagellar hook-associated protein 3 FlgL